MAAEGTIDKNSTDRRCCNESQHKSDSSSFTNFTRITDWCYNDRMKRATMTLPDDLAEAVENYVQAQEAPPTLTTVVQVALQEFLSERGFLRPRRPLKITPAGRSGRSDVSREHDAYLAGLKK
jgi:hypothetical protein